MEITGTSITVMTIMRTGGTTDITFTASALTRFPGVRRCFHRHRILHRRCHRNSLGLRRSLRRSLRLRRSLGLRLGLRLGLGLGGEEHAGEDRDDGDHDEQLDERESAAARHFLPPPETLSIMLTSGRNSASTMPPMTLPSTITMKGSSRLSRLPTATSTSSS